MLEKELSETIKVWPVVSKVISTLQTEAQYKRTVALLDRLIDAISAKEDPVIESLIDLLGTVN